ncbi:hypothetical protein [Saccharomonospora viridis]|uniref:Secreted protein n=2 Tax=Saccharomonospora viridis TaxID=1852 RepID=C7MVI0_SACVD|nr:hypothetical protein [Saccharomonospora viridis]ACU95699.1 hypothetical protein Svir_06280 [Saccharomonospora viridis DSM 43017]KHF43912.1 hypothetical protein MINT15_22170 [Saccharomonospora viridis]SFP88563.1 hypothetical protein SAMN02982918_3729 [Saccharomonospora viridis]
MRTRACVVLAAALFTLTGCSGEAGPTPKGTPDPGPAALARKVTVLRADDCHTAPTEVRPADCEKYVTQVENIPGNAHKYATGHPRLAEAADTLSSTLRAYRHNNCAGSGDADVCTSALTDMASALTDLHTELSALPDVTAQSG